MTGSGLHLVRWTVSTGSAASTHAAVVLAAGDHQWDAVADGEGAIGTLFGAVDAALEPVLGGRVRLVSFDVHAIGETAQADALVDLVIEPPVSAAGARASGRHAGSARHVNLVAACAEAYLVAIRALLGDSAWAGATDAAGNSRLAAVRAQAERASARASLGEETGPEPTDWFNR